MPGIGGITTYFDIQELITQSMLKERQPLEALEAKKQDYEQAQGDWSEINDALLSLKTSLTALKSASNFYSRLATSGDSDIVTAVASDDAAITSYKLTDITLAQAAKQEGATLLLEGTGSYTYHQSTAAINVTGMEVDPNALLNDSSNNIQNYDQIQAGSFVINGATITIDPATDTLYEVLSKINSSTAGVTATFVDGVEDDRIKIQSDTIGDETISFGSDTSNFLSVMNIDTTTPTQQGIDPYWEQTIDYVAANQPTSPLANVTDGYFNINGITFTVDTSVDSLQDILNDINDSAANVTAFYDESLDKVTITSKETGENIEFGNDTSGFIENVMGITGGSGTATFQPAQVTINGTALTFDGNTFTINGTTFTLHADSTTGTNIEVSRDTDKAKVAIEDFIEKYNNVMNLIETKRATGQPLQNERLLNNIRSELRTYVVSSISNPGEYDFLYDIGVEYSSGQLSLDTSKLENAFRDYPDSVGYLFGYDSDNDGVRDDGGIANTIIDNLIDDVTLPATGDISQRIDLLDDRIDKVEDDIEDLEERLAKKEARLWEEYIRLANALAQITQTFQWMNTQLTALNNFSLSLYGASGSGLF